MYWFDKGNCRVGPGYLIPGERAAVRKWVAPHGGKVRIEGSVTRHAAIAESVVFSLWLNSEKIWPHGEMNASRSASHDLNATVIEGDTLAFVVADKNAGQRAADPEANKITWDPVITYRGQRARRLESQCSKRRESREREVCPLKVPCF